MTDRTVRGRPAASSREILQEAAFELFLENGYAGTTIDQIAQRAGVSRNTFFNYFPGKSDVFWIDLDMSLDILTIELGRTVTALTPIGAVTRALVTVARQFGPQQVPWALTQHDLVGNVPELYTAAVARLAMHTTVIAQFLEARSFTPMMAQAAGWAAVGAAVAAVQSWAAAGTARGELAGYIAAALRPACRGFDNDEASGRSTAVCGPDTAERGPVTAVRARAASVEEPTPAER